MKKTENYHLMFNEMNYEELSAINGGSFAYDLGRLLRYVGIYYANGAGMTGAASANADFIVNEYLNSQ